MFKEKWDKYEASRTTSNVEYHDIMSTTIVVTPPHAFTQPRFSSPVFPATRTDISGKISSLSQSFRIERTNRRLSKLSTKLNWNVHLQTTYLFMLLRLGQDRDGISFSLLKFTQQRTDMLLLSVWIVLTVLNV